ncbi:hypothetical protein GA0074696_1819 [Micromonospora purpureochromogenes]|uniref:SseB protein N-terminal domain-containing protein n=1 Tax=Micromonospora purpureochromogenes TaxID=47872 RepID=A0A1C4WFH8_9ACTN|nr:hypothetical protein [Micromonospora purpureochromogenes]SCE94671.1 hypothetical protein GA0074696_1819 [Micromonospora purpureochromogenes]
MLLEPDAENEVAYELCQLLGRAILPVRPAGPADDGPAGTAFFFAHPTGEYLLTADVLTRVEAGEVGLRPSVAEPAGVAPDALVLPHFTDRWGHLPELGVAVLPTAGLHERAAGQGWRWRTQPVPDAVAAGADDVARIGAEPVTAIVLALGVRDDGSRPLEVAVERAVRAGDGLRITGELPAGYVGAPVFGVQADPAGEVGLRCLGLVLPGEGGHPVASFDRITAELPTGG